MAETNQPEFSFFSSTNSDFLSQNEFANNFSIDETIIKIQEERSIYDIIGKKIRLTKKGRIAVISWKDLQKFVSIYRDKRYETFRYLLIDDSGTIRDHAAVTCKNPKKTPVSPQDTILRLFLSQIRERAVNNNCKIVIMHNHPSGNVLESEEDRNVTRKMEDYFHSLFLGHIILDHGKYNVYTPEYKGWIQYADNDVQDSPDPLLNSNIKSYFNKYISGTLSLDWITSSLSVDGGEKWNDKDWVPVMFLNTRNYTTGLHYFHNDDFLPEPDTTGFTYTYSPLVDKTVSIAREIGASRAIALPQNSEMFNRIAAINAETLLFMDVLYDGHSMAGERHISGSLSIYFPDYAASASSFTLFPNTASQINALARPFAASPAPGDEMNVPEFRQTNPVEALISRAESVLQERAEKETVIRELRELEKMYPPEHNRYQAPNGKPSALLEALGEEQGKQAWYAVRTPSFKKWFGDWERLERIAQIENIIPIKIQAGDPINQKAAEDIARSFKALKNKDGRIAELPINTIGKLFGHKNYDFSRIIKNIPDLYETAVLGWSEPEIVKEGHKPHPNIKAYHHYVNKFNDSSGEYFIRITVNEEKYKPGKSGKNLVHSAAISDIAIYEKGDHSQRIRVISPGEESPSPFIDTRLQQFFESVKSSEVSRVRDANGEPLVVYHGTKNSQVVIGNNDYSIIPSFKVFNTKGEIEPGAWFSPDPKEAGMYGHLTAFFLNARNVILHNAPLQKVPKGADGIFRTDKTKNIQAAREIAVFSPTQIKSAVENAGTYSRDNPSIVDFSSSWPEHFPEVSCFIDEKNEPKPWNILTSHPEYDAAKNQGDRDAAARLVKDFMDRPQAQTELRKLYRAYADAIVVSVHAEEENSRNGIPQAIAEYIAQAAGIDVENDIVQSNKVFRTRKDSWYRFAFRPEFDGPVEKGRGYILIDDVFSNGGSFSELRRYIERQGGRVVHCAAMTSGGHGHRIALSANMELDLKTKYGIESLNSFCKELDLYGGNFKAFTEPEAYALLRAQTLDEARDRILAARQEGSIGILQRSVQGRETHRPAKESEISPASGIPPALGAVSPPSPQSHGSPPLVDENDNENQIVHESEPEYTVTKNTTLTEAHSMSDPVPQSTSLPQAKQKMLVEYLDTLNRFPAFNELKAYHEEFTHISDFRWLKQAVPEYKNLAFDAYKNLLDSLYRKEAHEYKTRYRVMKLPSAPFTPLSTHVKANPLTPQKFLEVSSSFSSPQAYENYYKYYFSFTAGSVKQVSPDKIALFDGSHALPAALEDNSPEGWANLYTLADYNGVNVNHIVPTPGEVYEHGIGTIKEAYDTLTDRCTAAYHTKEMEKDRNLTGESASSSVMGLPQDPHQEMKAFVKNPYVPGVPVPSFGLLKDGSFLSMEGWVFHNKEEQGDAVMLQKRHTDGRHETMPVSLSQYESLINNAREPAQAAALTPEILQKFRETVNADCNTVRLNTASEFWHNYRVLCREKAKNPVEAVAIARHLLITMKPEERKKFLTSLAQYEKIYNGKHSSNVSQAYTNRLLDYYTASVKDIPITNKSPFHLNSVQAITRSSDYIDAQGRPIDSSLRLKIGDTVKLTMNIPDLINPAVIHKTLKPDLVLASASRELNKVILIDKNSTSKFVLPMDDFVKRMEKVERVKIRNENKEQKKIHRRNMAESVSY